MADPVLKVFSGIDIKDAEKGEVEAVIATLGVIDRDGDIIQQGAIPDGAPVAMSGYGHDSMFGSRPVGKGVIVIDGNRAIFKGRVFLNTTDGRETFEVLREMGKDQEWSWGFRVLGSETPDESQKKQGAWRVLTKTKPFEVSPVLMGAGVGTRTVRVKSEGQADGAGEEEVDQKLVAEVVAAIRARQAEDAAEAKRLREEAEAEAARVAAEQEAECKAKAEAEQVDPATAAIRAKFLRITDEHAPTPQREYERFQRTMQRHKVA